MQILLIITKVLWANSLNWQRYSFFFFFFYTNTVCFQSSTICSPERFQTNVSQVYSGISSYPIKIKRSFLEMYSCDSFLLPFVLHHDTSLFSQCFYKIQEPRTFQTASQLAYGPLATNLAKV